MRLQADLTEQNNVLHWARSKQSTVQQTKGQQHGPTQSTGYSCAAANNLCLQSALLLLINKWIISEEKQEAPFMEPKNGLLLIITGAKQL